MISGLSIIQNGLSIGYPVLESFLSIEPIIDEYVIVEGYSNDGTYELLQMMQERWPKIKIFREEWPLSTGGGTWAKITDFGKERCGGDWILYVQPDEVWHPDSLEVLVKFLNTRAFRCGGVVVPMLDLGYNFQHIRKDSGMNRVVRNLPDVHSYLDSIGFVCGCAETLDLEKPPVNLGWVWPLNSLRKIVASRRYHEMGDDTPLSIQAKKDLALWDRKDYLLKKTSPIIDKIPPILHGLIGEPMYYVRKELLFEDGKIPEIDVGHDFYPRRK